ncbi:hypothetical protein NIES4074_19820 [Cylindrospermum sp. NIES-4074]|nr:hypothetical protein NIES4074_19820 [Cylindrospermum sp. NIES-4074]
MVPYLGDAAGKPIKAARNGKRILKLRKEIAELIQIIEKLTPGARRASGKTGDAVSQEIKRVLLDKKPKKTQRQKHNPSKPKWTNIFEGDKAIEHFSKHGDEVKQVLGKSSCNIKDYIEDANYVIKTGQYVPEMSGYVKIVGGKGKAKVAFVGIKKIIQTLLLLFILRP